MEDEIVVEIHALGVKKTKELVDEYNRALGDLQSTLRSQFGTCNINSAISIAIANTAINIGLEIVEFLSTFGLEIFQVETVDLGGNIPLSSFHPTGLEMIETDWTEIALTKRMIIQEYARIDALQKLIQAETESEWIQAREYVDLIKQSKLSGGN